MINSPLPRKKLGILGGMGPMASSLLYEKITAQTQAHCDQAHLDILLYSHASLPDRSDAIAAGDTAPLLAQLTADLQFLAQAGCQVLAIPCNTSHYFYHSLQSALSVPLLNMIDLCLHQVQAKNPKKVAVLATEGTLSTRLYQDKLHAMDLPCLELPCHIQNRVNTLIYQEIKAGKPGDVENFAQIEDYLSGQQVDCVILACTELSVFASQHTPPHHYVDALDILTQQCIQHCQGTLSEKGGQNP